MIHLASSRFWSFYRRLPKGVRELADRNYEFLRQAPSHTSLHFKKVGRFWAARVGLSHRALAVKVPEGFLWVWIGDHDEYLRLIRESELRDSRGS